MSAVRRSRTHLESLDTRVVCLEILVESIAFGDELGVDQSSS